MNITKEWLETCGSFSLEGTLYKEGITEPQHVTLSFEQGRPEPDLLLMPDFAPACLVASIVNLIQKGYTFSIQSHQKGCR